MLNADRSVDRSFPLHHSTSSDQGRKRSKGDRKSDEKPSAMTPASAEERCVVCGDHSAELSSVAVLLLTEQSPDGGSMTERQQEDRDSLLIRSSPYTGVLLGEFAQPIFHGGGDYPTPSDG